MNDSPLFSGWEEFMRRMSKQFPFITRDERQKWRLDIASLEKQVQDTVKKAMSVISDADLSNQVAIFETDRSVFVKIRIPEHIDPYDLRLFATPRHVRVQGLKTWGKRDLTVHLPATVVTKKAQAHLKGHELQVKLPKSGRQWQEREIFF